MEELIERYLWEIKISIEPTEAQKESAQRSHSYLRELLNSGQIGSKITGSFLSGSYSRDTAIKPIDDVDVIFTINPILWQNGLIGFINKRPEPSSVLQTFSNAIRYRYPVSSVYNQRRSIRLSLFHLDIDVVPAIALDLTANNILIPDSDADTWIKSAPKLHAERATNVNKFRGGRFKPLVKILKAWNGNIANTARFKSFCIETMATRIFTTVDFKSLSDGLIYFWDFCTGLGGYQQIFKWNSSFGLSSTYLTGLNVPESSGTGSNTAAGVSYNHQIKFAEYAVRSRDRFLAAKKASYRSTALGHLKDALYL